MEGKTPHEIDLAGTDGGMHARLAQGLIEAAHYLMSHPDLPIPAAVEIHYCIPARTDEAGADELARIAGMLRSHVTGDEISGTRRDFGPVGYRATYVSRGYMAAYSTHMAPFAEYAAESLARLHAEVDKTIADMEPRSAA